jgi:hypothetical protein
MRIQSPIRIKLHRECGWTRIHPPSIRIDFKPDGWIDRDVVDAIIAGNVKAELTLS